MPQTRGFQPLRHLCGILTGGAARDFRLLDQVRQDVYSLALDRVGLDVAGFLIVV